MAITTNRLTGMFSGLDTDQLVKSLVYGQQAKIDKLLQQKQKAEWKITAYKDFNDKFKAFRDNFGSVMGKDSLMSKATYNDFKLNMADNNSVKIIATASAKAGNYNVVVKNIATASMAKSSKLSATANGLSASALKSTSISALSQLARGSFSTANSEFSFSINGEDFSFSTDDSLQAVMDKVNASSAGVVMNYSQIDDKITIASKQLGSFKGLTDPGEAPEAPGAFAGVKPLQENYTSQIQYEQDLAVYESAYEHYQNTVVAAHKEELASWKTAKEAYDIDQKMGIEINDTSGFLGHLGIGEVVQGQDANVEINGEAFTLSDNTITLDGVQMTFLRPTETGGVDFDLTRNTDKTVETLKKFVEEFNSLVKSMFDTTSQKVNRKFSPLTESMKSEMTEKEIEQWEETAKEGLLNRDYNLEKAYNGLRSLITKSFGDLGRLSAIGITSAPYAVGASFELKIDEEKLRAALENDSEDVFNMFSALPSGGSEGGFVTQINKIMDNFTSSTKTREIDTLNKSILSYDKSIKEQEDKLAVMSERYYLQYAKLETALGQMQTQSDSLASMMGVSPSN